MKDTSSSASLIAHRGDRGGGIENTLHAFATAAQHGALFAECDIQFTRDDIPIVFHDADLQRLCNQPDAVADLNWVQLQSQSKPYLIIPALDALMAWLEQTPQLTLFIEIKQDILQRKTAYEVALVLQRHIPKQLYSRCVLISFSMQIIDACKAILPCKVGWVDHGGSKPRQRIDFVFMPFTTVLESSSIINFWHQQQIKVGLYTVNSQSLALQLLTLGADFIETDYFSTLTEHD